MSLGMHDAAVPLYMQIYNAIVASIVSGQYRTGDKLPSQRELSEKFGVSTVTTRKALELLSANGIIATKHGTGSFVAYAKKPQKVLAGRSFTETCKINHHVPQTKIISIGRIHADQWIASGLGISQDQQVLRIQRLRFMDQQECILEKDYFTELYFFLEEFSLENQSILEILSSKTQRTEFVHDDFFDISFATAEQAHFLNCHPGTPLLHVSEIVRSLKKDEIIYYNEQFIRTDRYSYATSSTYRVNHALGD